MRNALNRTISTLAILGLLLAGMPVPEAHAGSTITVNSDTEPNGLLWVLPDGLCTLREAVANANANSQVKSDCVGGSGADTITFSTNYTITLNMTPGELLITDPAGLTIQSPNVNYTTVRTSTCDPTNPSGCTPATWRLFEVAPGASLALYKMLVKFGRCNGACPTAADAGGGILVNHGSLTLSYSAVAINAATYGGGIYNGGGTVTVLGPPEAVAGVVSSNISTNVASGHGGGIYNDGGTLSIDGAVFGGNKSISVGGSQRGGGIYNSYANATLAHVRFEQNEANYGGGVFSEGGSLTVANGLFLQNRGSPAGGGLFNLGTSPSIDRVTFQQNYETGTTAAAKGAAIYNDASSPSITNSTFSQNYGQSIVSFWGSGGGIYNTNGSSPSLTNVTATGNRASNGGFMYNDGGGATIKNLTATGNTADLGGALYNSSSSPSLTNVTFSGNTAGFGGAIYNFTSNPSSVNAIYWGDTAPSGGPEMYSLFGTPVIDHSVVQGACPGTCTSIITADPLLGALGNNGGPTQTMALGAGSSALDAGTNSGCPSTDQRGVARPQGTICDIGAYEVDYFTISGNAGIAGASLGYVNGGAQSATADGSGNYSLSVPRHWTGTVTPSLAGYAFSPSSRSYSDVGTNQTAQNYSATLVVFTISGNAGIAYTSLSYPNGSGGTLTAYADVDGNYAFTVPMGWSGTVTPTHFNCTFTPADRSYSNVSANATGQDYAPTCGPWTYLIAGNAGIAGAVLQTGVPGQEATADSNGDYSLYVPAGWTGTITPSKPYCTFMPAQRSYTLVGADMLAENYLANCHDPGYVITGNAGAPGATIGFTGGVPTTADAGGKYSILVPPHWSGSVTPSKAGCTFGPLSESFVDVVADFQAPPFFANCTPPIVMIAGNTGTPGATLNYNDGSPQAVAADGSGNYTFFVPQHWSGGVMPAKPGCTFTPPSRGYNDVMFPLTFENYTAQCTAFLISGSAGIAGATLSYNTGSPQTATADGSGNYSFLVPAHWNGTVTPSAAGCTFSPTQRSYVDVTSDKPIEDYMPSCVFSISGNAGIAGASLDYYDNGAKTAVADGSGDYTFSVPLHWSGTVIPSLTGSMFTPAQRAYSDVTEDHSSQDYSAAPIPISISGNAGSAGATLSYDAGGPQSAIADEGGAYALTVPYGWSGTVTPSKTDCTFTPTDRTYSNLVTDLTAEDYSAACLPATILISGNAGSGGATISYNDGGAKSVTADADGRYGFTVPSHWSGSVTPSKPNLTFTPDHRDYADLIADQTNQDYSVAAQAPTILRVYPSDGSTACLKPQVGVKLALAALVRTPAGTFDAATVTLKLDGVVVTGSAEIGESGASLSTQATILYTPPSNLSQGSHQGSFIYPTAGGPATHNWNFTTSNGTCPTSAQLEAAVIAPSEALPDPAPAAANPNTGAPGVSFQDAYRRLILQR